MKSFIGLTLLALIISSCSGGHDHDHHDHDHTHTESHAHHDHSHHDHDHEHHHGDSERSDNLSPHVHGQMQLSIAVDGSNIYFQFGGSSDSLIGFEHEPKTEAEKKEWGQVQESWTTSALIELFSLEKSNCHVHSSVAEILPYGNHANIEIEGHIMCNTPLDGSTLELDLFSMYTGLQRVQLEVLTEEQAYSRRFTRPDKVSFEL